MLVAAVGSLGGCNSILGIRDIHSLDDAAPVPADAVRDAHDDARSTVDGEVDSNLSFDAAPVDANVTQGMIMIPAGLFERGCNASKEDCTNKTDEVPFLEITLSTYWIDTTEVTQAAYRDCVTAAKCTAPIKNYDPTGHATYPVSNVTWQQASSYCAWAGKRLPTEAEWEKAARGTDGRVYPWGNLTPTCQQAFWLDCPGGDAGSVPVGTHPSGASPYGVQDLAGNALEWVSDWYDNSYYDVSPSTDPHGPSSGVYKVSRGGAWAYGAGYLRTSDRYSVMPTTAVDQQGFRCAKGY
jgi:formylglycine-generating enzyme required for sulfatase activity